MATNSITPNGAPLPRGPGTRAKRDGERMAIYLLIGFLGAWLATMIVIQFVMAAQHGYGSGLGQQQRVPPRIVDRVGVGNDMKAIMKATNK